MTRPKEAGYACFLRHDFLDLLRLAREMGVRNDILDDFYRHLSRLEAAVQSYRTAPIGEWDPDPKRWVGFYTALRDLLGEGDWKYVNNPGGGFMGYWWHWKGNTYLQLEQNKLCFKIEVADRDKKVRVARWNEWHETLVSANRDCGLPLKSSPRREGQWMTVMVLARDYRQSDVRGVIDMQRTVQELRKVESLHDVAASR